MKVYKTILMTFIGSVLLLNSCSDLENLNTDTRAYETVVPSALMTTSQVSYMFFLTNTDPNFNNFRKYAQQWTNTEFVDEDRYDQTKRKLGDSHWVALYRDVLQDLVGAKNLVEEQTALADEIPIQKNKIAILEIQIVIVYQTLVDLYGNVPYSEALSPVEFPSPKYDDAKTIYEDLATRLDKAINDLDVSSDSFGSSDLFYNGDVSKWKKLGNSIKLKMGLHFADVDAARAKTMIESAYASGVISDNSENALLNYLATPDERNPVFLALTTEQHYVPTKFLVDDLNSKEDPRRDFYFDPASKVEGEYVGFPYAAGPSAGKYADVSNTGTKLKEENLPAALFDFAETSFLLADAANRGFNVGDVETHYNNGIIASMEYWGVDGTDINTYLSRSDVAFSTAAGTDKEKIAYQLWVAYYNRGFEAWTEYRRLDYPILVAPATAVADANGKVPVRHIYSHLEETLNTDNYNEAASAIGGDLMTTKLFWDKN